MTAETPKPKRKRWRWIIAGVLLFVAVVSWYWPRGDARFVGKWKVHGEDTPKSGDHVLDLWSGGVARIKWEDGQCTTTLWSVRDGDLILGGSPTGRTGKLLTGASQWLSGKRLKYALGSEWVYEIGELRPDEIISTDHRWSKGAFMRRIDKRTTFSRIPD